MTGAAIAVGLLRGHRDFRRVWAGDAVSQFGTRISMLAVPLVAVTTLRASTLQVAVLTAVGNVAFLVLGLPAGAWCDRLRRRPVLIVGDVGRFLTLASVPLAAWLGVLTIWQLYGVVLLVGGFTVFFDVAYHSYLPVLVGRGRLVEGNARLEANRTVAAAGGPTVAGFLVQWLTGPLAVAVDALSFAWSAGCIAAVGYREASPPGRGRRRLREEIGDGARFVLGHPLLRVIAGCGATASLFISMLAAIQVVFLVRVVGLAPGSVGVLFTATSVGAIVGALYGRRLAARLGRDRALLFLPLFGGLAGLLVPLTGTGWRLAFFAVGGGLGSMFVIAYNIVQVSYRQTICPDHLLGRMNATMRFLLWGPQPIGALLGGVLGASVGLRATLWIGASGVLLACGWLFFSPLRQAIRSRPAEALTEPSTGKSTEPSTEKSTEPLAEPT